MDRALRDFLRPADRGCCAIGRAEGGIMAGKNQDPEFRHPETVAHLQRLTDREAETHPPIVRENGNVVTRYWREGGEVRCCEVAADGASGGPYPEMEALHAAVEAEFGCLLPRLKAALRGCQFVMVNSPFCSWHPLVMEKLQRRFSADIRVWFREAVAEAG